jgi:hypothetical protein
MLGWDLVLARSSCSRASLALAVLLLQSDALSRALRVRALTGSGQSDSGPSLPPPSDCNGAYQGLVRQAAEDNTAGDVC